MRYVSRNHLRFDIVGNLSKPLHKLWTHVVFYYKYNTYQKYAIDLWENFCDWFTHKSKNWMLEWTLARLFNFTNINHPCPYNGTVYIKVKNISVSQIPFEPLIPSGRYRMDINITNENRQIPIFVGKLFFSVSDHRIERI